MGRVELGKGANAVVPSRVARVRLASRLPAPVVDLFALELTAARLVRDDGDVVFFNQRRSADGCLWLVDERCVRVALDELAGEVETVVVAAGLDDAWAGTFADDPGLRVRVSEAGESAWDGPDEAPWTVDHGVTVEGAERCVVLVELYRRDGGWKVRAVSQGWTAGTAALLTEHGVHVEHDESPEPVPDVRDSVRDADRSRRADALTPTLPELPVRPNPAPIPSTRPFPPYPWAEGAADDGVDASEAPTEIVASPAGAWPAWGRPAGPSTDTPATGGHAPDASRSGGTYAEESYSDGSYGLGPDGSDPGRWDARGSNSGGWDADRYPSGGTRHLRVQPVARASGRAPLDLNAMDPYDFEQLVANLLTAMGYQTQRVGRSGDGGVDVEVRSDDPLGAGLIVISVKRYKRTVGAHYVRELAGTVADRDAIKGILVTTSGFGPSSYEFAAKNRLELVDGDRLRTWLAEYLDLDTI